MGRTRTIPDAQIFEVIRSLMVQGGDKAVAFSSVGRAVGLAPATLVQRYGSRDGMLRAALMSSWALLDSKTDQAIAEAAVNAKGAAQLLKTLTGDGRNATDVGLLAADFRDAATREMAHAWRRKVETALAVRLGGAVKGREAASILFMAWQGQLLWETSGDKSFRMKDLVKRLS
jgi:AcrR family transcriptional regulator